jgi:hypothetical protein
VIKRDGVEQFDRSVEVHGRSFHYVPFHSRMLVMAIPYPLPPADLAVGPTSLIGLDRIRDGRKLALLIGSWGAPATYSGTGARSSAAASVAIAVIWRADLASAYWRAILRPALTCSTCCLAASSSRTVFSVGVIGSGLMAAVVASGHDGRLRWRFRVGAMATDLRSSSTVRSPGDADGFLRRVIHFPLQLRNGWLPKQFPLTVSR